MYALDNIALQLTDRLLVGLSQLTFVFNKLSFCSHCCTFNDIHDLSASCMCMARTGCRSSDCDALG